MVTATCPCLSADFMFKCQVCRQHIRKNGGEHSDQFCESKECVAWRREQPLPGQVRFTDDLEAEVVDDRGDWQRIGRIR